MLVGEYGSVKPFSKGREITFFRPIGFGAWWGSARRRGTSCVQGSPVAAIHATGSLPCGPAFGFPRGAIGSARTTPELLKSASPSARIDPYPLHRSDQRTQCRYRCALH